MIQRIQTIWLLLASICAFLTLKFSFYSGHKTGDPQKTYFVLNAMSGNFFLLVLTVAVAIAALVVIFIYKERKTQMRIALATFFASIVNVILFVLQTNAYVPAESSYDLTCVFVFVVPVLLLLAVRGIYKDEKLVKSVDRLR